MDKKVSINLLLFKPEFYLKPCLESVLAQSFQDFELLVIDNDSQDGTARKAKEILESQNDLTDWRVVENKENLGFAAGHNRGIEMAKGEIVILLNQDIILDRDYIKNTVEVFRGDEKIGSVQGKLLRLRVDGEKLQKTEFIDNVGLIILKNRRIIAAGQGQKDGGQFEKREEIFGVDGAVPVFRKSALEDIKLPVRIRSQKASAGVQNYGQIKDLDNSGEYFDEDFFMYKEDVDLAWRMRLAGWKSFYEPKAVAWHARTAGDSAAVNYFAIIRERLKINKFGKYHAFKNQRLMQIKNEQFWPLLKHLLFFLPKEIGAWAYVLVFERFTWKAIKELFQLAPRAWEKRKIIMAKKRISAKEIERWFA
ncbi:MAG: Glycosyl transferase, family 2 [Parcubacteria group bacterium GW2011_GWA1_42_7]|nr:MAG: Glycosyl transferase, family 2 [Parcubacteria group bacterium GW2011_GWB1_42_6]KKS69049.1 MAG: Glycosyl transferase, family 2 [Parcubacteria group bacterium GW2011_GWA1_42_7]KKS91898.1 MAG: Glycosyl transferase, family 2 [Parcubacteria group bacterium GW2011_GWC1_43_12]